jgi:hypothetical protein
MKLPNPLKPKSVDSVIGGLSKVMAGLDQVATKSRNAADKAATQTKAVAEKAQTKIGKLTAQAEAAAAEAARAEAIKANVEKLLGVGA